MTGTARSVVGGLFLVGAVLDIGTRGAYDLITSGVSSIGNPPLFAYAQVGIGLAFLISGILGSFEVPPMSAWAVLVLGLGVQWCIWDLMGYLGLLGGAYNYDHLQGELVYAALLLVALGALFTVMGPIKARQEKARLAPDSFIGEPPEFPRPAHSAPAEGMPEPERVYEPEPEPVHLLTDEQRAFLTLGFPLVESYDGAPSFEEVKRKYRLMVKVLHPDKFMDRPKDEQGEAQAEVQKVTEAYAILERYYTGR